MDMLCQCGQCQARFRVDSKYAGKKVRCPKCQAVTLAEVARASAPAPQVASKAAEPESPSLGAAATSGSPANGLFQIETKKAAAPETHAKSPAIAAPSKSPAKPTTTRSPAKLSAGKLSPAIVSYALTGAAVALLLIVGAIVFLSSAGEPQVADGKKSPPHQPPPELESEPSPEPPPDPIPPPDPKPPPISLPTPPARSPAGYLGWFQSFADAQKVAAAEKKDVLLAFVHSDVDEPSQQLREKVFQSEAFGHLAASRFVKVVVDYPGTRRALGDIENLDRNVALARQFHLPPIPSIILTDASGLPYYLQDAEDDEGLSKLADFSPLLALRDERDRLLAEADSKTGAEKLAAAAAAARWLDERKIVRHFAGRLLQWKALGEEFDPRNEQGLNEVLFATDWHARFADLFEVTPEQSPQMVSELDAWRGSRDFRDGDRGAKTHFLAADALRLLNRGKDAARHYTSATAYTVKDETLRRRLKEVADFFSGEASSGSGFLIAEGGFILTNQHVIVGNGEVLIRIGTEKAPAEIVAQDKQADLALLRCNSPALEKLPILEIASEPIGRAEDVAAFGHPLGSEQLNITVGIVSRLPVDEDDPFLELTCRVNPGNSGGPLCDRRGRVVGVVTAKSISRKGIDSAGMALPVTAIEAFLKTHLPADAVRAKPAVRKEPSKSEEPTIRSERKPPKTRKSRRGDDSKLLASEPSEDEPREGDEAAEAGSSSESDASINWADVDRRVGNSVLMVIKMQE